MRHTDINIGKKRGRTHSEGGCDYQERDCTCLKRMRNRLDSTSGSRLIADQGDIYKGLVSMGGWNVVWSEIQEEGAKRGDGAAYSLLTDLRRFVLCLITQ